MKMHIGEQMHTDCFWSNAWWKR